MVGVPEKENTGPADAISDQEEEGDARAGTAKRVNTGKQEVKCA